MARTHSRAVVLSAAAIQAMQPGPNNVIVLQSKFVGVVGGLYLNGKMHTLEPERIVGQIHVLLEQRKRELVPWTGAAIECALNYLHEIGKIRLPELTTA